MKKIVIILIILCSCINIFGQQGYKLHSSLEIYPSKSSLYFVQTRNSEQMMKIKENVSKSKDGEKIIASLAENGIIVNSKSLGAGNYISDIYQDKEGYKFIMLPRFAIKMKDGHDIDEVLSLYSGRLFFDEKRINVYMVDCNADNAEDVLAINTEINLLESVEWCEPMMIGEARKCNEYAGYQYYIKNTGQNGGTPGIDINVEPVWNILSANTSLIVAVLDDGVERDHEDLSGSVLNGKTIYYPNEYGDPIYEYYNEEKSHGTACAGIIGAKNDTVGIRGVASGVKILPINIYPYPYPTDFFPDTWYEEIGEAITWAFDTKGADVISCSNHFSNNNNDYIANALNNAMTYGRNGKGTVVVCSAGNSGSSVNFPANMSRTIAVGAVDNTGTVWGYSCRGNSLDLVAPSGACNNLGDVVTTDRYPPKGFNPNGKYTFTFGGTSAACPQVAGVVALMLSANPNLTSEEVGNILRSTAYKLPGMNGQNRTDTYGYGLVDAYAAVQLSSLVISGPSIPCDNSVYSIPNLPSGFTVTWSWQNSYNPYAQLMMPEATDGEGMRDYPPFNPPSPPVIGPILQQNTPSTNMCTLDKNGDDYINNTIVATIKKDGTTIRTLTKHIDTGQNFSGYYAQAAHQYVNWYYPGTSGNSFGSGNTIYLYRGSTITLTSSKFVGATLAYSGTTPIGWTHSGNTVSFSFPVLDPSPRGVNSVQSPASLTITGTYPNSCECFRFTVIGQLPQGYTLTSGDSPDMGLNISSLSGQAYSITCGAADGWELSVIDPATGETLYRSHVNGPEKTLNTTGWKSGIYIIKATVGDQTQTQKLSVK